MPRLDLNFFSLYNLKEFHSFDMVTEFYERQTGSKQDNYLAFLPIDIRSTNFIPEGYPDTNVDSDEDEIRIKIPWSVGEISDTVSAGFSPKGGGESALRQALVTWMTNANLPYIDSIKDQIAKFALVEFNVESLHKTIDLQFILPLTNGNLDNDFTSEARRYLGALQGLVYPRGYSFLYPKLLSFSFGGLYRGFRGFLSEVSLRYSDVMLEIGNHMFPQVITGNLRFVNVFKYFWGTQAGSYGLDAFILDEHPQVLFGYESDDYIYNYFRPGANSGTTEILGSLPSNTTEYGEALRNAYERSQDLSTVPLNSDLTDLSGGMQEFIRDYSTIDLTENFDLGLLETMISDINSVNDIITAGQLEFLGIDSDSDKLSLSQDIQDSLASIQDVSNYSSLLGVLYDHDAFSSLSILSKILGTTGNVAGETLTSVINMYWPVLDVLKQYDVGIDLNNVTYFYENILDIISGIESLPVLNSSEKTTVDEALYSNLLQYEKITNVSNDINSKVNTMDFSNVTMNPLTTIESANLLLLEVEILKNMSQFTDLNTALYEKGYELNSSDIIDNSTFNKLYEIYSVNNEIDIDQLNSISEVLYAYLNEIKGEIESV